MSDKKFSKLAVFSVVLGMLGLLWLPPLLSSVAAVVLGHMAWHQIGRDPSQRGRALALAGMLMGYLGALIIVLVWVYFTMWSNGGRLLP